MTRWRVSLSKRLAIRADLRFAIIMTIEWDGDIRYQVNVRDRARVK